MIPALTNHLWQSTLFVVAAALMAAALRANGAHVRHRVWLAASLKFLVPFSLLLGLGGMLPRLAPAAPGPAAASAPAVSIAVDRIAQPFTSDLLSGPIAPQQSPVNWVPIVLAGLWAVGFLAVVIVRLREWRRVRAAVTSSTPSAIEAPMPVRSSPGLLEPGIVGLWRPVLLLPAGIETHLTPRQLDAVLAHEACHVRRRDNVTAALHMFVEAVFWFHPLVWWVGARLVEERERACDEHVLRTCDEPQTYAESILNVCKLYVESPLACVSGVTGAGLKKRVAAIMGNRVGRRLTPARRVTLATAAVLALALPLAAGMVTAPLRASAGFTLQATTALPAPTLRFDVASVKVRPAGSSEGLSELSTPSPGRLVASCVSLTTLVSYAYARDDHRYQGVLGGPAWARARCTSLDSANTFDIEATMPPTTTGAQTHEMMRSLLVARFKLQVHVETRQEKDFALIVAPAGLKLKPSDPKTDPPLPPGGVGCSGEKEGCHMLAPGSWKLDPLALVVSRSVGRPVVNKTGLSGYYLVTEYRWRDDDAENSSLPTLSELLKRWGLELRSEMGPVDYLVIDHAELPTPDLPVSTPAAGAGSSTSPGASR
jgi:bla regulator protein blaR1